MANPKEKTRGEGPVLVPTRQPSRSLTSLRHTAGAGSDPASRPAADDLESVDVAGFPNLLPRC